MARPPSPRPPRARPSRRTRDALGFEYVKIGARALDFTDPYHLSLSIGWPAFVASIFAAYGALTCLFAALYALDPHAISGGRAQSLDAVFFSIETLATVGYGEMYPTDLYGHVISSAEIVTGMAFTAIFTGLIFVRFSRPKARIVHSEVAVITPYYGVPTLMIRIGNGRANLLTKTSVQLHALIQEETDEGQKLRRVEELALVRDSWPMFPLILVIMHRIDEASPLARYDLATIRESDVRLILSLESHDPQLGVTVHDLRTFRGPDLRPGMRFVDAVRDTDGTLVADLTGISEIEPDGIAPEAVTRAG